ncbi:methyltransferase domain-containing protein [uncultured Cohaesibacter sp.]|uniref:class I SAM-dependent methyltransferase n=1 Tax=uncultured Cohaesibacter sp. TaxID=1002546 RepID=UPI0029C6B9EC|nr:methyltransferase domain-containing protein [uncultured Cohaesibacter sp.]
MVIVPGNQGYVEEAEQLALRYDSYDDSGVHDWFWPYLPSAPASWLDVGAGTGRDAFLFTSFGHRVVAVEPTDGFRFVAISKGGAEAIEWIDDALPTLSRLGDRRFGVITLTAVFMHLDRPERAVAFRRLGQLAETGGLMAMTLRHGEVPAGRRMFEVPDEEVIAFAKDCGFNLLWQSLAPSVQEGNRSLGITWSRLAFRKT